jgi:hypothetical protein
MPPAEQLLDELGGDGMAVEEAGEDSLAERPIRSVDSHCGRGMKLPSGAKPPSVVSRWRWGCHCRRSPAVGNRNDEAGADVLSGLAADELDGRFCARPGELGQEASPAAKERPQQARDGENHVAVRDESEQLLAAIRPRGAASSSRRRDRSCR